MSASAPFRNWRKRVPSGSSIPRPVALFERFRREIDRLRKENKDLQKKAVEDRERIAELEKKADLLKKEVADREKKIDDLEHQLAGRKKDSSNSSKPPSSDGPAARKRVNPQRKKSRRKPGGQKGHPGKYRVLVPTEKTDKVIEVFPSACTCGHRFPRTEKAVVGQESHIGTR